MRAYTGVLAACCWAATSAAYAQNCTPVPCAPGAPVEIQFNFTVSAADPGGPDNTWNLPGPVPTTLQETFYVDPASATGSYTTQPGPNGSTYLDAVNITFDASNVTLSANGQILGQSASGMFVLSGDGPVGSIFGGVQTPYGGGSTDFHSQNMQAPPDWEAFLSTSTYNVAPGVFTVSGSFGELNVVGQGEGSPVSVSVPEPGSLALFGLAGLGLLITRRRAVRPSVAVNFTPRPRQLR